MIIHKQNLVSGGTSKPSTSRVPSKKTASPSVGTAGTSACQYRRDPLRITFRIHTAASDNTVDHWKRHDTTWKQTSFNIVGVDDMGQSVIVSSKARDNPVGLINKIMRDCRPGDVIQLEDVSLDPSSFGAPKMFVTAYIVNKMTSCKVVSRTGGGCTEFTPSRLSKYTPDNGHDNTGFLTAEGFNRLPEEANSNSQNLMVRSSTATLTTLSCDVLRYFSLRCAIKVHVALC